MNKKPNVFLGKVSKNVELQLKKNTIFGSYLKISSKDFPFFQEESRGRVLLDFIPYPVKDPHHPDRNDEYNIAVPGSLWYRRPFKVHRSVGIDKISIICPTSIREKCPICNYRTKLLKEGVHWKDESVTALRPSERNLYIVVPINHKKFEPVPHIWDISDFLFQSVLNNELQENEEAEGFPDLYNGKTVSIRFVEGEFNKNKYLKADRIDFLPREKEYDEKILEEIPNLDEILNVKSYEEIERIFLQVNDEDHDSSSSHSSKTKEEDSDAYERPRRSLKSMDESDDEDEERETRSHVRTRVKPEMDDVEDEEEEVEEKPKAKASQKVKSGECPAGYRWGIDGDRYDECGTCPVWDDCMQAKEEMA